MAGASRTDHRTRSHRCAGNCRRPVDARDYGVVAPVCFFDSVKRPGKDALVPEGRCADRVAVVPLHGRVGNYEDRSAAAATAPTADPPGAEEGQCRAAVLALGCEVAGGHRTRGRL